MHQEEAYQSIFFTISSFVITCVITLSKGPHQCQWRSETQSETARRNHRADLPPPKEVARGGKPTPLAAAATASTQLNDRFIPCAWRQLPGDEAVAGASLRTENR